MQQEPNEFPAKKIS